MIENSEDKTKILNDSKSGGSSLETKIKNLEAERRDTFTGSVNARYDLPSDSDVQTDKDKQRRPRRSPVIVGLIVLVGIIILGFAAWALVSLAGSENSEDNVEAIEDGEGMSARELELQQQLAQSEFENLEKEFSQYEISQQEIIVNDTLKQQLEQKYQQARLQVEELRAQLKDAASKSAAEIQRLNDQIKTLRELLKHYLEEIDRLNKENQQLRSENEDLRQTLNQTATTLQQTQSEKEILSERMSLAEKLNVTGVSMTMLNKKNKAEKKIKNAKQFLVTFTIPQNNSTPPGTKNIYAVITTPEGQILDGAGTFMFENSNVTASARKQIDYGGEEIGGITMFYDIKNALSPGTYTVQLFCDGYALMSRPLEVQFKN